MAHIGVDKLLFGGEFAISLFGFFGIARIDFRIDVGVGGRRLGECRLLLCRCGAKGGAEHFGKVIFGRNHAVHREASALVGPTVEPELLLRRGGIAPGCGE